MGKIAKTHRLRPLGKGTRGGERSLVRDECLPRRKNVGDSGGSGFFGWGGGQYQANLKKRPEVPLTSERMGPLEGGGTLNHEVEGSPVGKSAAFFGKSKWWAAARKHWGVLVLQGSEARVCRGKGEPQTKGRMKRGNLPQQGGGERGGGGGKQGCAGGL